MSKKVFFKNIWSGLITLKPNNGFVGEKINVAPNAHVVFDSESHYSNYSVSCSTYIQAKFAELFVGELPKASKTAPKDPPKDAPKANLVPDAPSEDEKKARVDEIKAELKVLEGEFKADSVSPKKKEEIKAKVAELKKEAKSLK